jgi:hypothetical protein
MLPGERESRRGVRGEGVRCEMPAAGSWQLAAGCCWLPAACHCHLPLLNLLPLVRWALGASILLTPLPLPAPQQETRRAPAYLLTACRVLVRSSTGVPVCPQR